MKRLLFGFIMVIFQAIPMKGWSQTDVFGASMFATFSENRDAPLSFEADEFFIDQNKQLIVVSGDVEITRGDLTLFGEEIRLDSASQRLLSDQPVRLVNSQGDTLTSANLDMSFDMASASFAELSLQLAQTGRFTSSSFQMNGPKRSMNGVTFTTCKTCEENPDKPRLWTVEADEVIDNSETGTISFRNVRLKMMGVPIAYLPYFKGASPTVERKSGFLMPTFRGSNDLGFITKGRYHFALAPDYDLTVEAGLTSKSLFFSKLNWRHLTERGRYTIRPLIAYTPDTDKLSDITDSKLMAGLETSGQMTLNKDWDIDWSAAMSNEPTLFRSLGLTKFDQRELDTVVNLKRQTDYNLTQIKGLAYKPINETDDINRQGQLMPEVRYRTYGSMPNNKSEFDLRGRLATIDRSQNHVKSINAGCDTSVPDPENCLVIGAAGTHSELNLSGQWRTRSSFSSGLIQTAKVFVGFNAERADVDEPLVTSHKVNYNKRMAFSQQARMALDYRLPLLQQAHDTGILEPIVQVVATYAHNGDDTSQLMSETDQSFVLTPLSLFDDQGFSSHSLWQSGVRVNYGLEYSGTLHEGLSFRSFIGQSAHIAGDNAYNFSHNHLSAASGFENKVSDILMGLDVNVSETSSFDARLNLAKDGSKIERFELGSTFSDGTFSGAGRYIRIAERASAGFTEPIEQIVFSGSIDFDENWALTSQANYDILNSKLISRGLGLRYDDECFTFNIGYDAIYLDGVSGELTKELKLDLQFKPFDSFSFQLD